MNTRVALLGIIAESVDASEKINEILHEYQEYIVGRMGVPYRSRDMFIISVIVDAPEDVISAISGKMGMVESVTAKAIYSKA